MNNSYPTADAEAKEILTYWFGENIDDSAAVEARYHIWFQAKPADDEHIRSHYELTIEKALRGELAHWRSSPEGAVAEIIVSDQFPRNIYRGDARAFSGDAHALERAQVLIADGLDEALPFVYRMFVYLPLEHAENLAIQDQCVGLFRKLALDCPSQFNKLMDGALRSVEEHQEIIHRFGRFPHRNKILGRKNSAAELAYMEDGGRSFGQVSKDG